MPERVSHEDIMAHVAALDRKIDRFAGRLDANEAERDAFRRESAAAQAKFNDQLNVMAQKVQGLDALDAKADRIAGAVETLTALFSNGPPAVSAKVGWKEHLKIAGTIGACLGLFVFLYRMIAALAPAFNDFMLKVQV